MTVHDENVTYHTVAERLRAALPDIDDISSTLGCVEGMFFFRTVVTMTDGRSFTGHAEVTRGSGGGPQSTCPLETAGTSSVGLALAFAGHFGSETGIAGIEEIRIAEGRVRTQRETAQHEARRGAVRDAAAGRASARPVSRPAPVADELFPHDDRDGPDDWESRTPPAPGFGSRG
ncbi:MAG: hypothetical protein NTX54_10950 [Chloroflexi bacterium]|nr:hypothetical protein [Chloroflexota bacterium]